MVYSRGYIDKSKYTNKSKYANLATRLTRINYINYDNYEVHDYPGDYVHTGDLSLHTFSADEHMDGKGTRLTTCRV